MRRFELALPRSVEEALRIPSERGSDAKLLAGGTDLLPQMKNGVLKPACVIDLSGMASVRPLKSDARSAGHIEPRRLVASGWLTATWWCGEVPPDFGITASCRSSQDIIP